MAGGLAGGGADGGLLQIDAGLLQYTDCPGLVERETVAITAISGGLAALVSWPDGGADLDLFSGDGCSLTKVQTRRVPTPSFNAQLTTDARGVLYYGTSGFALIELNLDGGVLGQTRESIAALAVAPDGLTAYAAFVGNPVRLTRTNLDAGFSRDATFVPPPLSFVNALATRAGQVFAMGSANVRSPHYIHVLGLDGGLAATWGSMNAFDPDGFCTFSDAVLCGAQSQDVCIVDQNCPAFSQWTSQGQQRARLRFSGSGVQPFAVAAATNRRAWVLRGTPGRGRTLGLVSGL